MATDAERCRDEDVIVVGGGNSAGQAAVHLASRARSVRVVVRGKALKSTMSHYLVDRIERSPRIEVMTETEVTAVHGTATVESVSLRNGDGSVQAGAGRRAVFVMIGAEPCTEATTGMLAVDAAGYLLCGAGAAQLRRAPRLAADGPRAAPARDGPPGRVRRRRRARRARRTAWPARSATARWSCASRTTCSTASASRSTVAGVCRAKEEGHARGHPVRRRGRDAAGVVLPAGRRGRRGRPVHRHVARVLGDQGDAPRRLRRGLHRRRAGLRRVRQPRPRRASDAAPGKPRREIDPWEQIRDYQHAITLRPAAPRGRRGSHRRVGLELLRRARLRRRPRSTGASRRSAARCR